MRFTAQGRPSLWRAAWVVEMRCLSSTSSARRRRFPPRRHGVRDRRFGHGLSSLYPLQHSLDHSSSRCCLQPWREHGPFREARAQQGRVLPSV